MSIMTIVALIASIVALTIGTASIVGETGYRFDLRRKRRRKDGDRLGGRREADRAQLPT